jgi:SAM-dependent methyltransferase
VEARRARGSVVTRASGAARIFSYNWPIYVGTWAGAAAAAGAGAGAGGVVREAIWLAAAIAFLWAVASLAVSFYVYDRSRLSRGAWLPALVRAPCNRWATVHAGLDAEIALDAVMPGACVARLDVFDERFMKAPSIRRARRLTPRASPAVACSPTALALENEACDAVVVAFTAHEIRDRRARERFFDEVCRGLRPGGTMVLVEHVRDLMNFVAFGPGYLHFLPRAEWLRLAARPGFAVSEERRITPWVMALALEKTS